MQGGEPVEAAGRELAFGQIEDGVPVAMMARNSSGNVDSIRAEEGLVAGDT